MTVIGALWAITLGCSALFVLSVWVCIVLGINPRHWD